MKKKNQNPFEVINNADHLSVVVCGEKEHGLNRVIITAIKYPMEWTIHFLATVEEKHRLDKLEKDIIYNLSKKK